ncbi:hypothetical protein BKA62DRAFT_715056 [Auriculariales sp. MPI-PUGE-AT-0066]|nr:hypothetical protein BKA62DRAFT_715056 [Auriculariales sp. MPI-PUGE-AT-0066]
MSHSFSHDFTQQPDFSLGSLNSSALGSGLPPLPQLSSTRKPSGLSQFSSSDRDIPFDPTSTPGPSKLGLGHRRRSSAATSATAATIAGASNTGGSVRQSIGGVNLTLREQEKVIDSLKKENFSLKLKVHFLEERLQENNPEHVELALRQNINLKIEVQSRGVEIKRLKKQLRDAEAQLGQAGDRSHGSIRGHDRPDSRATGTTAYSERERELELLLEERERELRDLRRRKGGVDGVGGVAALQDELDEARGLLEENIEALERMREDNEVLREDKENLLDQLDGARLELEAKEQEIERERTASRAGAYADEEQLEELNSLRDKLAATEIQLQTKEEELDARDGDIEHIEAEWRQEVAETRGQMEDLHDANAELEQEVTDLRQTLAERDEELNQLRDDIDQLEQAAQAVNAELEQLAAAAEDLEAANEEIKRLGERVFELEDELETKEHALEELKNDMERELSISAVLKEKLSIAKEAIAEAEDETDQYRQATLAHKAREEELAAHAQDLAAECQTLQKEFREVEDALAREESARKRAEDERAAGNAALARSEAAASDRFELELEVEKLQRETARLRDDLARAQSDLATLRQTLQVKEQALDEAANAARDAISRDAANSQARLNLSEKLDAALERLKSAEKDRERAAELEARLGKDQRALLSAEGTFRDQISERNTLLLTIWSYLDKILGPGSTPKSSAGASTTKPFTNFVVFNDGLLTRLKALSALHAEFEKRVQTTEAKLMERVVELKRTFEGRWRVLERVEGSVKNLADAKASWRRKVATLQGELEGARATIGELGSQVSAAQRRPGETAKDAEIRALTARATNAERRLANAQNQLAGAEERVTSQVERASQADGKWEARVKEYESRIKAAEERVKRERQGAKERVAELENSVKSLQRQVEIAKERQRRSESKDLRDGSHA